MTVRAGAAGSPSRGVAPSGAGAVATGVLIDELAAAVGGARHEARFIVEEARAVAPGDGQAGVVPAEAVAAARAMAARRAAGEPLQYIFGHWPFRGLDLRVDPRVLIPRPETEQVVEVALGEARRLGALQPGRDLVVVDAGTGSGAIALALATELGAGALRAVWATDASAGALAVASANLAACRAAASGALPPVELAEGSWLMPLPDVLRGRVDLVVSNPPYVTEEEWAGLAPEVRAEPRQALVAGTGSDGTGGLAGVESVLDGALLWLGRPGAVVVELAPHQAEPAIVLALQRGYDEGRVEADLAGRPRALVARLRGSE